MTEEDQTVAGRQAKLARELDEAIQHAQEHGRTNYRTSLGALIFSVIASALAAILGIVPIDWISKWEIGVLAAISTVLISANRQLGFQQKANWHYRKLHHLRTLKRRLEFELPDPPTAKAVAAIASEWSRIDSALQKEWEDMQRESKLTFGKAPEHDAPG